MTSVVSVLSPLPSPTNNLSRLPYGLQQQLSIASIIGSWHHGAPFWCFFGAVTFLGVPTAFFMVVHSWRPLGEGMGHRENHPVEHHGVTRRTILVVLGRSRNNASMEHHEAPWCTMRLPYFTWVPRNGISHKDSHGTHGISHGTEGKLSMGSTSWIS